MYRRFPTRTFAPKQRQLEDSCLHQIVTVSEAARLACVSRDTIHYHVERGNLNYRHTDRVYLITLESLVKLYKLKNTPRIPLQSSHQKR